jgi:hypothetical protein
MWEMWTTTEGGAGIAYPSGAPEFTPIFNGVRVVLFAPLFTDSDYNFGISKIFFHNDGYLIV